MFLTPWIIDSTMLEIYNHRISNTRRNMKSLPSNISIRLAIEMSLKNIEEENNEILNALKHLSLCPSGLSDHHLRTFKGWSNWVDRLKDRDLIIENKIYEEDINRSSKPILKR